MPSCPTKSFFPYLITAHNFALSICKVLYLLSFSPNRNPSIQSVLISTAAPWRRYLGKFDRLPLPTPPY